MKKTNHSMVLSRLVSDYGMLLVLFVLCGFFSWLTWTEQSLKGAAGGEQLAGKIIDRHEKGTGVLIVTRKSDDDVVLSRALRKRLEGAGLRVLGVVNGPPAEARHALEKLAQSGERLNVIACSHFSARWTLLKNLDQEFSQLAGAQIAKPASFMWPVFLKRDNLLNVANQIVVIAVIAIGMTMVIITAGIDLSVGSLIALSAVVTTLLIRDFGGAREAGPSAIFFSCLAGIAICALMGLFSGCMVTFFRIPPFIATLAMMLVASGLAYIFAKGYSIYEVPASIQWLGRGTYFAVGQFKIPNAVILMIILYVVAHIVMTYTTFGRYVYAVGGNIEAARLSGVPVRLILVLVYTICGALAGLGGVITASQLSAGAPTYGFMYELNVIAAVVVGGSSLAGGEGKILGTLIGAFIIAVIQNGMNLTDVESYTQKVVLGLVILGAVLLDMLKKRGWSPFKSAGA